jgi:hypothetical protein
MSLLGQRESAVPVRAADGDNILMAAPVAQEEPKQRERRGIVFNIRGTIADGSPL